MIMMMMMLPVVMVIFLDAADDDDDDDDDCGANGTRPPAMPMSGSSVRLWSQRQNAWLGTRRLKIPALDTQTVDHSVPSSSGATPRQQHDQLVL